MSTLKTDVLKDVAETVTIPVINISTDITLRQDLADSVNPLKGAGQIGWSRTVLDRVISTVRESLDGTHVNIWEYANLATGYVAGGDISTWDWRPAIQAAVTALLAGQTLHFPAPHIYRVVNATSASGTTIVERRADAVLNGTLFAITSATNRIAIRIDGQINGTSALDDIFRLTGEHVTFYGQGTIRNVSGEFLDTNVTADPLVQWYPSLVRLDGNHSGSNGITYYDQPTVGLRLMGDDNWADRNIFVGGPTAHGAGTILFGIYAGQPSVEKFRHVLTRNKFLRSAENGACYSGVFCTATSSIIAFNEGKSVLEHLVYNYGQGSKISYNDVDDAGTAAGFQNFAENVLIQGNTAKNCAGGLQTMHNAGVQILDNDFSQGITLSGIALRTFPEAVLTDVEYDVIISRNKVAVTGPQSCIDVVTDMGMRNLTITDNVISNGPVPGGSGLSANIRVTSNATAGLSRNLNISGNMHRDCAGYAITVFGFSQLKINGETIRNSNGTSTDVAIRLFSCTHGEVYENTVEDTRGTKLTARICLALTSDSNTNITMHDNNGIGLLSTTNALCAPPTGELAYNNTQDSLGNVGLFTMTAASGLTVNSGISAQAAAVRTTATVVIEPLNKAAVDQQAGTKRLYVSGVGTGSFNVATSDGTAAVAATYTYRIIQ